MALKLFDAAKKSRVQEVKDLLRSSTPVNLNWKNPEDGWTPLHAAARFGNKEVIELLADHPQIDVNVKNNTGTTPFLMAAFWGKLDAVKVFLKSPKVQVNEVDSMGNTPVWFAAFNGHLEVVRWMVASARDIDFEKRGNLHGAMITPAEAAQKTNKVAIVTLLEDFKRDPDATRDQVRASLNITVIPILSSYSLCIHTSPLSFFLSFFAHPCCCYLLPLHH